MYLRLFTETHACIAKTDKMQNTCVTALDENGMNAVI